MKYRTSKSVLLILGVASGLCVSAPCFAQTCGQDQLGGSVFRDYDADGVQDTLEPGVAGITITVYDDNGTTLATGSSDSSGNYVLSNVPAAENVRVEFSGLPSYLKSGPVGANSDTSVVFVTNANTCTVDFGLQNAAEYCGTNPYVALPCYVNGDPLLGGSSGTQDALVAFPYLENGASAASTAVAPTHLAQNSEIGATWGTAYQRSTKKLFVSAIMKRHAGFGALGTGGIYAVDVSNLSAPSVSSFIDLQTIGVSSGSDPHVGLPADMLTPNTDNASFPEVGKRSIGDMDISEDEKTLWLVSLNDRKLYSVFIDLPAQVPTNSDVTAYTISNPGCADGDYRPWAVAVHDGQVYVGVTCTAETSQTASNLGIYVLRLDGSSFTTIFQTGLNYTKGYPIHPGYGPQPGVDDWQPWARNISDIFAGTFSALMFIAYPQPLLTDIEFDSDGSMILGMADRTGHQFGDYNFPPAPASSVPIIVPSGGDLLRACKQGSSWVIESNGSCPGGSTTIGAGDNQGPGGGEYYYDEFLFSGAVPAIEHAELALGGLALLPGSGEVMSIAFDPVLSYETGGTITFNNQTGARTRNYEVYAAFFGSFGKAAGLGEPELLCAVAPLEIGNRVWLDQDRDGVQDPGEPVFSGVTVRLYDGSNTLIASTTTDSSGHYYFTTADGLLPNTSYRVAVDLAADYASGGKLAGYELTSANQDQDQRDSDGATVSGYPSTSLTTGAVGENDHTFDFGFVPSCTPEDQTVNSVAVDAAGLALEQTVRAIIRLRRASFNSGICANLSESAERNARRLSKMLYMSVWQLAYDVPDTNYTCATTQTLCSSVSNVSTKLSMRQQIRTIYRRARLLLCPKCLPYVEAQRLRQAAIQAQRDAAAALQAIPDTNNSCDFAY